MQKNKLLKIGSKLIRGEIPELFFRGREVLGKMSERRRHPREDMILTGKA